MEAGSAALQPDKNVARPAAEPTGPRSTRGPCRSSKGDCVHVLADVGDHHVHVRAGELHEVGERANGAITRRKARTEVRPRRFDSLGPLPPTADLRLTTSLKHRPTPQAATNHPLRVMPLTILLSEYGRIPDVED